MIYFSISYENIVFLSIILTVSSDNSSTAKHNNAHLSDIPNTRRKSDFESTAQQYTVALKIEKGVISTSTEKIPNIGDDICLSSGLCRNVPASGNWFCNCDQECRIYNDCCVDHNKNDVTQDQPKYECLSGTSDASAETGYFVSVSCPHDYRNQTIIDRCSRASIVADGPFVVSNESRIFRNEFCAFCNSVTNFTSFNLQFYNLRVDEDHFRKMTRELLRREKLNYTLQISDYKQIIPSGTVTRFCLIGLHATIDFACQLFVNPVLVLYTNNVERLYRNSFCVTPGDIRRKKCIGKRFHTNTDDKFTIHELSVIFSFKSVVENIDNIECAVWSQQGTCSYLETYQNKVIDIEYFLTSNTNLTLTDWSRISLMSVWTYEISNISSLIETGNINVITNNNNMTAYVQFKLKIIKRSFYQEMKNIETYLKDQNIILIVTDNTTQETVEVQIMRKDLTDYQNVSHIYDYATTYKIYNAEYLKYHLFDLQVSMLVGSVDELCGHWVIKVTKLGDLLRADSYECLKHIIQVVTKFSVLSIVTYVAFSLSVVALIGLIVFNRKHNLITNIPGSNLENISVSLLLSNVLFMIGIGVPNVFNLCYAIGVLLHYLWLSVFSFMTISITFIVKNIHQMKARNTIGSDKVFSRRRMLTFIGLAVPLMIVGLSVFIDKFGPDYLSLGYDGQVCFPNRYPGNVIFFTGPVIVSVIWNFLCLSLTIFQICRVRYQVGNIRKSVPFEDAMVYLRIVVLSGMLWTFGIASAVFESELLEYIFTILCGLQGVCIAIANLTTSKVRCFQKPSDTSENVAVTKLSTFSG
ncbi:CELSR3 [Mytilus coruscus]|uniref:CELSR3 n=1 Tax=Mytilus coruscus TaxID=42192 RepID=A0A6J8DSJ5_MYTCO|nr:CELSR3 [Mytilus coruscus]